MISKRFLVALLMVLALLLPITTWAGMKIVSHKVFVGIVSVRNNAISREEASAIRGILAEGLPKYCLQFGSPSLLAVSRMDSAEVRVSGFVTLESMQPRVYKFRFEMKGQGGSIKEVELLHTDLKGDLVEWFKIKCPDLVRKLEPVIISLAR